MKENPKPEFQQKKGGLENVFFCATEMGMDNNNRVLDQIDKILALADSDHDGEALGALRMARRMLMREGLCFTDLVSSARRGNLMKPQSFFCPEQVRLEAQIDELSEEISAHIEQNQSLSGQVDFWRRRAFELEQMLAMNQAEANRWKEMARETAERLWDIGQMAQAEAFLSTEPLPETDDELFARPEPLKAVG